MVNKNHKQILKPIFVFKNDEISEFFGDFFFDFCFENMKSYEIPIAIAVWVESALVFFWAWF